MEALTGGPCFLDSEHVMFVIFQLPQPNAAQKFLYGNFLNLCVNSSIFLIASLTVSQIEF